MKTEQKLARIANRHTLYEIEARHEDGRKLLVCYSPKSGHAMSRALTKELKSGETRLGLLSTATNTLIDSWKWVKTGVAQSGEWVLQFSGRTQREAIITGELPSIYRS